MVYTWYKPRVIRRGGQADKTGRFKVAMDYRLNARVERVKARDPRSCAAGRTCVGPGLGMNTIPARTEYVKVHANEGQGKFIRGRMIYSPRDYHFECVPEKYRPLLRFIR